MWNPACFPISSYRNVAKNNTWYLIPAFVLLGMFAWWVFSQSHLPGSDGYYLVEQANSVVSTGGLKIHNSDPTPYLVAGLIRIGLEPVNAVRVILIAAAAAWFWLGLETYAWMTLGLAPLFFYHLVQFPKLSLSLLLAASVLNGGKAQVKAVKAALAACFHPLGALCLVPALGGRWKFWFGCIGAVILFSGLLLVGALQRNTTFSLQPLAYKLLTDSQWPDVARICLGAVLLAVVFGGIHGPFWLLLISMMPSTQGDLFGPTERGFLACVLLTPFLLSFRDWKISWGIMGAVLMLFLIRQMPVHNYGPVERAAVTLKSKDFDLLVVSQTDKFYFTAMTGKDAYYFEPEATWNKARIWRLVQEISVSELLPYMKTKDLIQCTTLDSEDFLIREDSWDSIRSQVKEEENESLYHRVWSQYLNPCMKRPRFLSLRT